MATTFLSGDRFYVRAMQLEDKEQAPRWFDSPFPINAVRAEAFLREVHRETWHPASTFLAIVRNESDEILGGVSIATGDRRSGWVRIAMAPALENADELRADALRLLIPWWRDEFEFMAVTVEIAADQSLTIAAAEELGMVQAVRWRDNIARSDGYVDLLLYQALNRNWSVPDA